MIQTKTLTFSLDISCLRLQLTPLGEQYYEFYGLQYHTWLSQVLDEIPKEDLETTIRTIYQARKILQDNHPPKP